MRGKLTKYQNLSHSNPKFQHIELILSPSTTAPREVGLGRMSISSGSRTVAHCMNLEAPLHIPILTLPRFGTGIRDSKRP